MQIKNEIAEVRQLLKVYRQKRRSDSEDSEKPTRFKVESGDEVSEREEVRDSNYVGTDLYWENRFYQVKPFKPPEESGNEQELLSQGSVEMQDGGKTVNSEDIKDKEFVMVWTGIESLRVDEALLAISEQNEFSWIKQTKQQSEEFKHKNHILSKKQKELSRVNSDRGHTHTWTG